MKRILALVVPATLGLAAAGCGSRALAGATSRPGSELVSTTSKSVPVSRPSEWSVVVVPALVRARREMYQGEPLSARIIP